MARISIEQLDDFSTTFLDDIVEGQVPAWNATLEKFVPYTLPNAQIIFRRSFLLMGA